MSGLSRSARAHQVADEGGVGEGGGRERKVSVDYENRFARIESDLAVVKWMIGFNLAMTVAVLWKVFSA